MLAFKFRVGLKVFIDFLAVLGFINFLLAQLYIDHCFVLARFKVTTFFVCFCL